MNKELKNTDKVMVSCRIPIYVKEYIENKGLGVSQVLMAGFDSCRATDKDHAVSRLQYHEERVLHWRHIVLQHDEECNTKHHICNTIKKEFLGNGRGSRDSRRMDISWCEAKAEQLVNEGIVISGKELYDFCVLEEKP